MRKKSHISLARYLVKRLDDTELKKHRTSFYIGSILPDIKPSFFYKRHEISKTFPLVSRHIARLSQEQTNNQKKGCRYFMDLGQITHYLADYFTFPHNRSYSGGIREHCSYEEKLKKDLRQYIKSGAADRQHWNTENFDSAKALCQFIQNFHKKYIGGKHDVEDDIRHILEINFRTVQEMMRPLSGRRGTADGYRVSGYQKKQEDANEEQERTVAAYRVCKKRT